MSEKVNYFIAALDLHLSGGKPPETALRLAVEDYAAVWHAKDDMPIMARAARVALRQIEEADQGKATEN